MQELIAQATLIAFSLMSPARLLYIVLSTWWKGMVGCWELGRRHQKMQVIILSPSIPLNPLAWQERPIRPLLEESSPPLPRDQAKTSLETNASQTDAHLPQGHPPSPHCFEINNYCPVVAWLNCGSGAHAWKVKIYFTEELQNLAKIIAAGTRIAYLK